MLEKKVPLLMEAGGDRFVVGHADLKIHDNGDIEMVGTMTDPHVCDLLTGDPTRNPLCAIERVSPFSIGPGPEEVETS